MLFKYIARPVSHSSLFGVSRLEGLTTSIRRVVQQSSPSIKQLIDLFVPYMRQKHFNADEKAHLYLMKADVLVNYGTSISHSKESFRLLHFITASHCSHHFKSEAHRRLSILYFRDMSAQSQALDTHRNARYHLLQSVNLSCANRDFQYAAETLFKLAFIDSNFCYSRALEIGILMDDYEVQSTAMLYLGRIRGSHSIDYFYKALSLFQHTTGDNFILDADIHLSIGHSLLNQSHPNVEMCKKCFFRALYLGQLTNHSDIQAWASLYLAQLSTNVNDKFTFYRSVVQSNCAPDIKHNIPTYFAKIILSGSS